MNPHAVIAGSSLCWTGLCAGVTVADVAALPVLAVYLLVMAPLVWEAGRV